MTTLQHVSALNMTRSNEKAVYDVYDQATVFTLIEDPDRACSRCSESSPHTYNGRSRIPILRKRADEAVRQRKGVFARIS